jgi:hypothetical protein
MYLSHTFHASAKIISQKTKKSLHFSLGERLGGLQKKLTNVQLPFKNPKTPLGTPLIKGSKLRLKGIWSRVTRMLH